MSYTYKSKDGKFRFKEHVIIPIKCSCEEVIWIYKSSCKRVDMSNIDQKKCYSCKKNKDVIEFNKDRTKKSGTISYCKTCVQQKKCKVCKIPLMRKNKSRYYEFFVHKGECEKKLRGIK